MAKKKKKSNNLPKYFNGTPGLGNPGNLFNILSGLQNLGSNTSQFNNQTFTGLPNSVYNYSNKNVSLENNKEDEDICLTGDCGKKKRVSSLTLGGTALGSLGNQSNPNLGNQNPNINNALQNATGPLGGVMQMLNGPLAPLAGMAMKSVTDMVDAIVTPERERRPVLKNAASYTFNNGGEVRDKGKKKKKVKINKKEYDINSPEYRDIYNQGLMSVDEQGLPVNYQGSDEAWNEYHNEQRKRKGENAVRKGRAEFIKETARLLPGNPNEPDTFIENAIELTPTPLGRLLSIDDALLAGYDLSTGNKQGTYRNTTDILGVTPYLKLGSNPVNPQLFKELAKEYKTLKGRSNPILNSLPFVASQIPNAVNYGVPVEGFINDVIEDKNFEQKANGGTIKIKPSKKGTFTAAAKKHGKSVQGFASQVLANKDNYSPAMVKKANFARNAAKWKKAMGGLVESDDSFNNDYMDVFDYMAMGGTINPSMYMQQMMYGSYAQGGQVPQNIPVEVEGEEMYEMPNGQVGEFQGAKHENGGIPIALPEGTKIYSDRLKINGKTMAVRKDKREANINKLEKLLTKNPNDKFLKEALKRQQETNALEEQQDMQYQEQVNEQQAQQEQAMQQMLIGAAQQDMQEGMMMAMGGMIKRADGSYSKRGLWDNIRANKGSGKKPTKEMLKQEKKIRAAEKAYGGMIKYADGGMLGDCPPGQVKDIYGNCVPINNKFEIDPTKIGLKPTGDNIEINPSQYGLNSTVKMPYLNEEPESKMMGVYGRIKEADENPFFNQREFNETRDRLSKLQPKYTNITDLPELLVEDLVSRDDNLSGALNPFADKSNQLKSTYLAGEEPKGFTLAEDLIDVNVANAKINNAFQNALMLNRMINQPTSNNRTVVDDSLPDTNPNIEPELIFNNNTYTGLQPQNVYVNPTMSVNPNIKTPPIFNNETYTGIPNVLNMINTPNVFPGNFQNLPSAKVTQIPTSDYNFQVDVPTFETTSKKKPMKEKRTGKNKGTQDYDFTKGDKTGMFGTSIGMYGPALMTMLNRLETPPNINFFSTFGQDALRTQEEAEGLAGISKDEAYRKNLMRANALRKQLMNTARGVNDMRSGQLSAALTEQEGARGILANYLQGMSGLKGQRANLQQQIDQTRMGGEQQRDLADRQDIDQFYTNLAENVANASNMMQKQGRDLNVAQYNKDIMSLSKAYSKYGVYPVRTKSGVLTLAHKGADGKITYLNADDEETLKQELQTLND